MSDPPKYSVEVFCRNSVNIWSSEPPQDSMLMSWSSIAQRDCFWSFLRPLEPILELFSPLESLVTTQKPMSVRARSLDHETLDWRDDSIFFPLCEWDDEKMRRLTHTWCRNDQCYPSMDILVPRNQIPRVHRGLYPVYRYLTLWTSKIFGRGILS